MKLTLSIIILLVLATPTVGQCQSLPAKQQQYDFLKWYVSHTELKLLSDTTVGFKDFAIPIKEINEVLAGSKKITKINRLYVTRQMQKYKAEALDTAMLHGATWKPQSAPKTPVSYISLPTFSINGHMAFIIHGYNCGMTCGREGIEVYRKTKSGEWKKADIFNFPFSVF